MLAKIQKKQRTAGWITLFFVLSGYLHIKSGFTYPVPWPDEAAFIYPSLAFAEHGTFFAPELASRTLYWMPPGYMFMLGIVFKFLPFSLSNARWISFIFLMATFVLFLKIFSNTKFAHLKFPIVTIFFLDASMITCANISRMESFLLFTVASTFYLFQKKLYGPAVIISLLSVAIHPNGAMYLPGIVVCFIGFKSKIKFSAKRFSVIVGIIILLGIVCSTFVIRNFSFIVHDITYQFSRKFGRDISGQLADPVIICAMILMIVLTFILFKYDKNVLILSSIAIPSLAIKRIGWEIWYNPFQTIFFMILTFCLVAVFEEHILPGWKKSIHFMPLIVICVALLSILKLYRFPVEILKNRNAVYITQDEIDIVSQFLRKKALQAGNHIKVTFNPPADALFFNIPSVDVVLSVLEKNIRPDHLIFHLNQYTWNFEAGNLSKLVQKKRLEIRTENLIYVNGMSLWPEEKPILWIYTDRPKTINARIRQPVQ